ncbi:NUDIX domain-containing protein [Phycicoccus endophyticus]|uniref:NUDIX domain-containing protein n=1 Tax=Phycicoccus endophyticus TaxID=1690220 RepID=A0A7G9R5N2_9MICO|nr:NUDIX domain-containing protein [Phycicoccus endophyticus]QNN50907.1 NUDIX domain-containing protein [Phycicoccus endophyticus]
MRVLVVDDEDRVLLFHDSDHGLDPSAHFWDTPGGGVDPGESDRQAAVRELVEETGQRVHPDRLAGPLLERVVVHGYSDKVVDQTEVYFGLRMPAFEVDPAGHTEEERLCIIDTRWWRRTDLATTVDDVWPRDVLAVLSLLERPHEWREGPVLGPTVEESTLPA